MNIILCSTFVKHYQYEMDETDYSGKFLRVSQGDACH